jgi:hypothetical protein
VLVMTGNITRINTVARDAMLRSSNSDRMPPMALCACQVGSDSQDATSLLKSVTRCFWRARERPFWINLSGCLVRLWPFILTGRSYWSVVERFQIGRNFFDGLVRRGNDRTRILEPSGDGRQYLGLYTGEAVRRLGPAFAGAKPAALAARQGQKPQPAVLSESTGCAKW